MNKTSTESEKQNNHIEITKGSTNIGPICYNVVTLSQAICVCVCAMRLLCRLMFYVNHIAIVLFVIFTYFSAIGAVILTKIDSNSKVRIELNE